MLEKGAKYFVTSRTFQGRYLMRPRDDVREMIGGLFARASNKYSIKLFGYVFMSNHFHLIIEGDPHTIPRFVGWLKREIAVRVGRDILGWTDGFWGRRYDIEKILDDGALEQKLQYISSHGVKEGLVSRAVEWPGLHCIHQIGSDEPIEFELPDKRGKGSSTERLQLTRMPHWKGLRDHELRRVAGEFSRDVAIFGKEMLVGRKPLGLDLLMSRPFDYRPDPPERKRRPTCHSTSRVLRLMHALQTSEFRARFAVASAEYRSGNLGAKFPKGAYRPPLPPPTPD